MPARTAFLAKFIGTFCVLVSVPMAINKQATLEMVSALVRDAPVLYVFGLVVVAAGVALVVSHNVWSGGAVPILVTLVGWATLIKGLLFLYLPPPAAVGIAVWGPGYDQFYYLDVACAFVLGAYLAYCGFKARTHLNPKAA